MKQSNIMYTIENYNTHDVRIKLCGYWKLLNDNYKTMTGKPYYEITNIQRDKYE